MGRAEPVVGAIARGGPTATVNPNDTIVAVARQMRQRDVGSLIVVDEANQVVGIISERDVVRRLTASCDDPTKVRVADIMTSEVASCTLSTPVSEANELMVAHHIRHLPVIENGKLMAMTSSRDILAHQLRVTSATRASAEQTARLIKCLKSLELDELLRVICSEVPKVFQAQRWILCLADDLANGMPEPVIRRTGCPCPEADLPAPKDTAADPTGSPASDRDVPGACRNLGCEGPRVAIALGHDERADDRGCASGGKSFLCMCGLPADNGAWEEVLQHKGELMQDILNAALGNAILYEKARRRGLIDPLTGLKTRRVLEIKLAEEYERGTRYGSAFCVALADVDYFKRVNDTHGHAVGDDILRAVAEVFSTAVRASDTVIRYGGDEFVLVMPETHLNGAVVVLERIRSQVAEGLTTPDGRRVTVSCGVVEWSGQARETTAEMLRRADAALYEAKALGRNCVAAPAEATAA